jgi:hypothetical protein
LRFYIKVFKYIQVNKDYKNISYMNNTI